MTIITRRRARAALAALWLACPAWAVELDLPIGARQTLETGPDPGTYRLPTGPWHEDTGIPAQRLEGVKSRQAWRIDSQSTTTLQLLVPLRDQLRDAGYDILFECAAAGCGGFDFRFQTEVLPGPAMYVNLSDYRFVSARKPGPATDAVSLLVSRSGRAGFVQIIRMRGADLVPDTVPEATPTARIEAQGDLVQRLESAGHVVLRDLQFASGSTDLGDGTVESLDRIADYLLAHPDKRIVFVGHTDATGTLDANIALSRSRAAAVVRYLTTRFDIPEQQISARGVGFLSPLSTNLTDAGRLLNRRVEAVLTSTQ